MRSVQGICWRHAPCQPLVVQFRVKHILETRFTGPPLGDLHHGAESCRRAEIERASSGVDKGVARREGPTDVTWVSHWKFHLDIYAVQM